MKVVDGQYGTDSLGKTKRFRGRIGKRPDFKKAMITLVEGQSIDVTTGI